MLRGSKGSEGHGRADDIIKIKCVMNLSFLFEVSRYHFAEVAAELMNHYCIIKNDSRDNNDVIYRFAEIEFYFYDSKEPDVDVVTYNRDCKCVEWFFHKSGVDIAFVTQCKDKELERFGGILIRGIEIYRRDALGGWKLVGAVGGPRLAMFEIFNHCCGMPDVVAIPDTFEKGRSIRVTSRVGMEDQLPQRFVFDDVNWGMETESIIERKDENGKYHVLLGKSARKYTPAFGHDYGLSM